MSLAKKICPLKQNVLRRLLQEKKATECNLSSCVSQEAGGLKKNWFTSYNLYKRSIRKSIKLFLKVISSVFTQGQTGCNFVILATNLQLPASLTWSSETLWLIQSAEPDTTQSRLHDIDSSLTFLRVMGCLGSFKVAPKKWPTAPKKGRFKKKRPTSQEKGRIKK